MDCGDRAVRAFSKLAVGVRAGERSGGRADASWRAREQASERAVWRPTGVARVVDQSGGKSGEAVGKLLERWTRRAGGRSREREVPRARGLAFYDSQKLFFAVLELQQRLIFGHTGV